MPKFSEQIVDDSGYQRPVEGALVFLLDSNGSEADTDSPNPTWTDNFGVFSFIADDGVYRFSARIGGVEIARGDALIGAPPEFKGPQGEGLADVMAPNGATLVGFVQNATAAINRDMAAKAREWISIKDFGAIGAPADDTAAIQAAYDSGASLIYYPPGEYLHKALTISTPYQRHYGPGAKLTRTQAGATITVANAARGVHFVEMRFGCQTTGMAGDNITVNAPDFRWMLCESRDCGGRALLIANAGGGANIFGGVMQTAGTGVDANDWDFEMRDDPGGENTLYCAVFGVITNQHEGGFLITGEVGTTTIECCQFGKLRMDNGGSSRVSHSRINSDATILSGFATFVSCNLNGNTVFGQTGRPNIGSICFDNTNLTASYGSLTINGNVIQSSFHLGQVISAGTPVTIHPAAYNNDLWHPGMDVSALIDLGAESGSPTKGNAIVSAWLSAAGRDRTLRVSFQAGSTTNFGGGNYFTIAAPFTSRGLASAPARVTAGGALAGWTAYLRNGTNQVKFTPSSGGNDASGTSPVALGNGTLIEFAITAEQTF